MGRTELVEELSSRIYQLHPGHPVRVAIDGIDAAGKTVFADALGEKLRTLDRHVIRASVDGFHNPAEVRRHRGPLSPDGYYHDSFDYTALRSSLLDPLGPGGDRRYRVAVFDFRTDRVVDSQPQTAPDDAILVFEGVFLLRPELRGSWDFSVFLRVDFGITVARAESRDLAMFGTADEVRERYERRYVPGQRLYLDEACPESVADLVIDNSDFERPFVVRSA